MTRGDGDQAHWERVKELLGRAREVSESERAAFVDREASDDARLADSVHSLLAAGRGTGPVDELERELRSAFPTPSFAELQPGMRVGEFEIVRELGRGGMGAVYLGHRVDAGFEQRVAIKLIRAGADGGEGRRRFVEERRILASLEHPNISRLVDGGVTDSGVPYFAMEHVDGVRIDDFCDTQELGVGGRLHLFSAVCGAVQYAHQNLVVHRDIKPANILVTEDGIPKLLDFGIAKLLEASTEVAAGQTLTITRRLTPDYASPEQVRGESVSTASDVYSLGVLLYRLLTGEVPHPLADKTPAEIERVLNRGQPVPPSEHVRSKPRLYKALRGDLDQVVLKALSTQPERRYSTAGELGRDVQRYLSHQPVTAQPDTRAYRLSRFVRRHRVGVSLLTVAAVAILVGSSLAVWQARRASTQARIAEVARDDAEREAETAQAVSDFLSSLFESADPAQALGQELTAGELLDLGRQRIGIDGELSDEPAVRAAMLGVLGSVYRKRGELDVARELLVQAVDIHRESADDSVQLADAVASLGSLEFDAGNTAEAAALATEAADIQRAALGADDPAYARSLTTLAGIQIRRRILDSAAVALDTVAAIHRRAGETELESLANALDGLGVIARRQNRNEAAEARYREAFEIRSGILDPKHPNLIRSQNNIAVALAAQRRYAEAEPFQRQVVASWEEVLGDDHFDVAIARQNLAAILENQGRLDEAEPLYLRALEGKRAALGPDHPSTAVTLGNLGSLNEVRGDLEEAARYYQLCLAARERSLGADHPAVAAILHSLARTTVSQGDSVSGQRLYERALEIRRQKLDSGAGEITRTALDLARLKAATGSADRAQAEVKDLLEAHVQMPPPDTGLVVELRTARAEILLRLDRLEEAESELTAAYELLGPRASDQGTESARFRRPDTPPSRTQLRRATLTLLVDLYRTLGDDQEADAFQAELQAARGA